MRRKVSLGFKFAILFTLVTIIAVVTLARNPANAVSGGPVRASAAAFGGDQLAGQVSASNQSEYTYQEVPISDEYALQKIEQTFGPEVAASLKYRATQTTQSVGDNVIQATTQNVYSNKWCGYYVQQDPNANCVRADFNVCKNTTSGAADEFTWVGLGNSDNGLIQCGYAMKDYAPGGMHFEAFYEELPANPTWITDFSISKGDDLGATVQRDLTYGNNYYYVCVFDETTGYYFAGVYPYTPAPVSAEWIVETPVGYQIGSFGTETFKSACWWDAANPGTTYGITISQNISYHIKMETPLGEYMTAYQDSATGFHAIKTSS